MVTTETIAMGDGVATEFGFSFPYLKTEDVKVELQEYDATQTPGNQILSRQTITDFVIPSNNPTIVQFSSIGAATNYQAASGAPLANHAVSGFAIRVRIYRFTDTDSIPATFIQGSAVRAQDLNDNFEQTLYIMQERQNALLTIQTGGIGENVISTNALQDDSVDASKLRDSAGDDSQRAVTTNHIRDNTVTTAKIVDDAVTTAKIVDDAVTTAKIVDDAVTTAKITDLNVTTGKLADNAVTTAKITDLNVTTGKLADSAVTSGKIADDTIVNADVNSAAAIDGTKINPDFGNQTITTTGDLGVGTSSPAETLHVAGDSRIDGILHIAGETPTSGVGIEVGSNGTADRNAAVDLIGDTTYTDYGLRVERNPGANGGSSLRHRGTGNFNIICEDNGQLVFYRNGALTAYFRVNDGRLIMNTTGARGGSGTVITSTNDTVASARRLGGYIEWVTDIGNVGTNYFVSDVSLKDNIVDSTANATDFINNIEFKSFDWKEESGQTGHVDVGVVAQQLEQVDSRLVNTLSDGKKSVNEPVFVTYLAKSLQEALARITELEAQVTALQGN